MRRKISDYIAGAYYLTAIVLSALTGIGDAAPALIGALGRGPALTGLAICYGAGGLTGLASRLARRRQLETIGLTILMFATFLHGGALIAEGATASGVRLWQGILLMAIVWIGVSTPTITRAEVRDALDEAAGERHDRTSS